MKTAILTFAIAFLVSLALAVWSAKRANSGPSDDFGAIALPLLSVSLALLCAVAEIVLCIIYAATH